MAEVFLSPPTLLKNPVFKKPFIKNLSFSSRKV